MFALQIWNPHGKMVKINCFEWCELMQFDHNPCPNCQISVALQQGFWHLLHGLSVKFKSGWPPRKNKVVQAKTSRLALCMNLAFYAM